MNRHTKIQNIVLGTLVAAVAIAGRAVYVSEGNIFNVNPVFLVVPLIMVYGAGALDQYNNLTNEPEERENDWIITTNCYFPNR